METTEKEVITQIHNEFDTAAEKLLQEAKEYINAVKISSDTEISGIAERLIKTGFINVPTVKKFENQQQEKEQIEKSLLKIKIKADTIEYYQQTYPFLKFLTIGDLNRICNKYKLIYAPVDNYIKDVPEKNLKEIEEAQQLKEGDISKRTHVLKRDGLFICAPKTHFDLKNLKNEGLFYSEAKPIIKDDPIVFRFCAGGIQVLTKWGLEANDESLINPIIN